MVYNILIVFTTFSCAFSLTPIEEQIVTLIEFGSIRWLPLTDNKENITLVNGSLRLQRDQIATFFVVSDDDFVIVQTESCAGKFLSVRYVTKQKGKSKVGTCVNGISLFHMSMSATSDAKILEIRNVNNLAAVRILKVGSGKRRNLESKESFQMTTAGRARLNTLAEVGDSLMLVSILGLRGPGKSFVASLLSGHNFSDHQDGITSRLGIRLSPVLLFEEYCNNVKKKFKLHDRPEICQNGNNATVIFSDSEELDMYGARADILSVFPAFAVSNLVVWVTANGIPINEQLTKLSTHLELCKHMDDWFLHLLKVPLIIVVNDIKKSWNDVSIEDQFMTDEPVNLKGSTERNKIRRQLKKCFLSVKVIGLSYLFSSNNRTDYDDSQSRTSLQDLFMTVIDSTKFHRYIGDVKVDPGVVLWLYDSVLRKVNMKEKVTAEVLLSSLSLFKAERKIEELEKSASLQISEVVQSHAKEPEASIRDLSKIWKDMSSKHRGDISNLFSGRTSRAVEDKWSSFVTRIRSSITNAVMTVVEVGLTDISLRISNFSSICHLVDANVHRCIDTVGQSKFAGLLSATRNISFVELDQLIDKIEGSATIFNQSLWKCQRQRGSYLYNYFIRLKCNITKLSSNEMCSEMDDGQLLKFHHLVGLASHYQSCNLSDSINLLANEAFSPVTVVDRNILSVSEEPDLRYLLPKAVLEARYHNNTRFINASCNLNAILSAYTTERLHVICLSAFMSGSISVKAQILIIETVVLKVEGPSRIEVIVPEVEVASPGQPGNAGHEGGNVYIRAKVVEGDSLLIRTDGGKGGKGGKGQKGRAGDTGKDGTSFAYEPKSTFDDMPESSLTRVNVERLTPFSLDLFIIGEGRDDITVTAYQYNHVYSSFDSTSGQDGKDGEEGHIGGPGGNPGKVFLDIPDIYLNSFNFSALGGSGGEGGEGGDGGEGGLGGRIMLSHWLYTRTIERLEKTGRALFIPFKYHDETHRRSHLEMVKEEYNGLREASGKSGKRGPTGLSGFRNNQTSKSFITGFPSDIKNPFFDLFLSISIREWKSGCKANFELSHLMYSVRAGIANYLELNSHIDELKAIYLNISLLDVSNDVIFKPPYFSSEVDYQDLLQRYLLEAKEKIESTHKGVEKFDYSLLSRNLRKIQLEMPFGEYETLMTVNFTSKLLAILLGVAQFIPAATTAVHDAMFLCDSLVRRNTSTSCEYFFSEVALHMKPELPAIFSNLLEREMAVLNEYGRTSQVSLQGSVNEDKENLPSIEEIGLCVKQALSSTLDMALLITLDHRNLGSIETLLSLYDTSRAAKAIHKVNAIFSGVNHDTTSAFRDLVMILDELSLRLEDHLVAVTQFLTCYDDFTRLHSAITSYRMWQMKDPTELSSSKPEDLLNALDGKMAFVLHALIEAKGTVTWKLACMSELIHTVDKRYPSPEQIAHLSHWANPSGFQNAFQTVVKYLSFQVEREVSQVSIVLDEIDYPQQFQALKAFRRARFTILTSGNKRYVIHGVRCQMIGAAASRVYTVLFRPLSPKLARLQLPYHSVYESTYQIPGPVWLHSFQHDFVRDPNNIIIYPFPSLFEVEIPTGHQGNGYLSNENIDLRGLYKINVELDVRFEAADDLSNE